MKTEKQKQLLWLQTAILTKCLETTQKEARKAGGKQTTDWGASG